MVITRLTPNISPDAADHTCSAAASVWCIQLLYLHPPSILAQPLSNSLQVSELGGELDPERAGAMEVP